MVIKETLDEKEFNSLSDKEKEQYLKLNVDEKIQFTSLHRLANEEIETESETHIDKDSESDISDTVASSSKAIDEDAAVSTGKRGRHPIPCDRGKDGGECDKCKAKKGAPTVTSTAAPQKTLSDELSEYKDVTATVAPLAALPTAAAPVAPKLDPSKFINGAILLMVINSLLPTFILFILGFIDPKYKRIKPEARKKLKLDKSERAELEEGANEVVKFYLNDIPPIFLFLIGMSALYYEKFDSLDESDFKPAFRREVIEDVTNRAAKPTAKSKRR